VHKKCRRRASLKDEQVEFFYVFAGLMESAAVEDDAALERAVMQRTIFLLQKRNEELECELRDERATPHIDDGEAWRDVRDRLECEFLALSSGSGTLVEEPRTLDNLHTFSVSDLLLDVSKRAPLLHDFLHAFCCL